MFMGRKGIINTKGYIRKAGRHKRKVLDNVREDQVKDTVNRWRVLANE